MENDHEKVCPNCGYCPTCGRSAQPVVTPSYPIYPVYPYPHWPGGWSGIYPPWGGGNGGALGGGTIVNPDGSSYTYTLTVGNDTTTLASH